MGGLAARVSCAMLPWAVIFSNVLNLPSALGPCFMVPILTLYILTGNSSGAVGQWGKLLCRVMDDEGLATGLGSYQKYLRAFVWGFPTIVALVGLCWVDNAVTQSLVIVAMIWHLCWSS